ncbi:carbohydrate deacetylase-like [Glandiceps talaboti]
MHKTLLHKTRAFIITMSSQRRIHKLVINADDFGYCPQRNKGIVDCFEAKAITSSSLIINGAFTKEAVTLAKTHKLPLGLHLNLTEGNPVHIIDQGASSLVDTNGYFLGKFGFREAIKRGTINMEEVRHEMQAQIDNFRELVGHLPLYVDGHHHCHVISGVAKVFAELLSKNGIRVTRLPVQYGLDKCSWVEKASMSFYQGVKEDAITALKIFKSHGISHPHGYIGLSTMGANMSVERIQTALDTSIKTVEETMSCSDSTLTFELMTHPGYQSIAGCGGFDGGPDTFALSKDREHEIMVLNDEKLKQYFVDHNIQLCSFDEMTNDYMK